MAGWLQKISSGNESRGRENDEMSVPNSRDKIAIE